MEKPKRPSRSERVAMMLQGILSAKGEVMGCEECFELLDRCAELLESGQTIDTTYPEVKKHLDDCVCCLQEFESLLTALGIETSTT